MLWSSKNPPNDYAYEQQIANSLDRNCDGIFFHPRTGMKDSFVTDNDKVHQLPRIKKTDLNHCPRVKYHNLINARRPNPYDASANQATGQFKTNWNGHRGNYASKHIMDANQAKRWTGVQTPDKRTFVRANRY